jgi:hypothetical protein
MGGRRTASASDRARREITSHDERTTAIGQRQEDNQPVAHAPEEVSALRLRQSPQWVVGQAYGRFRHHGRRMEGR